MSMTAGSMDTVLQLQIYDDVTIQLMEIERGFNA
jgi:hypothetical protein